MMPELPVNPPEPVEVAECAWCGGEIYAGDEVARIDDAGGYVHNGYAKTCAEQYAMERVYDRAGVIERDLTIG